jgi:hypothetical protein
VPGWGSPTGRPHRPGGHAARHGPRSRPPDKAGPRSYFISYHDRDQQTPDRQFNPVLWYIANVLPSTLKSNVFDGRPSFLFLLYWLLTNHCPCSLPHVGLRQAGPLHRLHIGIIQLGLTAPQNKFVIPESSPMTILLRSGGREGMTRPGVPIFRRLVRIPHAKIITPHPSN